MAASHTVLSLDLGGSLGWCIGRDNKIQVSGEKQLTKKDAHAGDRFLTFMNWLPKFQNVDEIFFEKAAGMRSMDAANTYCGLRAILLMFGQSSGVHITSIWAPSVKKIFTGQGGKGVDKLTMCNRARALGWTGGTPGTPENHNEADACAIYYSIMYKRGIDITFASE
jgi:hypothetical protein